MNAWALTGLVILAASALAAAATLLKPRPKGRRCGRCAYDLSATPSRRCPECGHVHRRESDLTRPRRRWLRAVVLLAAGLLASAPAFAVPRVEARGARGAIPTAALMLAAPWLDPGRRWPFDPAPQPSMALALGEELIARLGDDQCWRWQKVLFTRACAHLTTPSTPDSPKAQWLSHASLACDSLWAIRPTLDALPDRTLRLRARWTADRALFAEHDLRFLGFYIHGGLAIRVRENGAFLGGSERVETTYLGTLAPGPHELDVEMVLLRYPTTQSTDRDVVWSASRRRSVEIVPTVDDLLVRWTDERIAELLSSVVSVRASEAAEGVVTVTIDEAPWLAHAPPPPLRFRLRATGTSRGLDWTVPLAGFSEGRSEGRSEGWTRKGAAWTTDVKLGATQETYLTSLITLDVSGDLADALAWPPAASYWRGDLRFAAAPTNGTLRFSRVPDAEGRPR